MLKSLTRKSDVPFASWQREMNHLFDRFNKEFGLSRFGSFSGLDEYCPRIEVTDLDHEYLIRAEVPGMTERDINVTLRENNLVLEGERKVETKKEDEEHYFSEFNYGSFYRNVPLTEDVDPNKVKASYKDGILTVELEKIEESRQKAKKIPIMKH